MLALVSASLTQVLTSSTCAGSSPAAAEATAAGAVFLPLHDLGAPDGSWQRTVTVDGRPTVIRSADGSHFTVRGYGLVADMVLDDLTERAPKLVPVAVPEPIRTLALQ